MGVWSLCEECGNLSQSRMFSLGRHLGPCRNGFTWSNS